VMRAVTTGKATTASIDFSETIVRVYYPPARKTRYTIIEVQLSEGSGGDQALRAETRNHGAGCGDHDLRNAETQLEFRSARRRAYARLSSRDLTRGSRVIAFCSVADEWGVSAHPGGPCLPTANSPRLAASSKRGRSADSREGLAYDVRLAAM